MRHALRKIASNWRSYQCIDTHGKQYTAALQVKTGRANTLSELQLSHYLLLTSARGVSHEVCCGMAGAGSNHVVACAFSRISLWTAADGLLPKTRVEHDRVGRWRKVAVDQKTPPRKQRGSSRRRPQIPLVQPAMILLEGILLESVSSIPPCFGNVQLNVQSLERNWMPIRIL